MAIESFSLYTHLNPEQTLLCENNGELVQVLKGLKRLGKEGFNSIQVQCVGKRNFAKPVLANYEKGFFLRLFPLLESLFGKSENITQYYECDFVVSFLERNKGIASECPNQHTVDKICKYLRHLASRFPDHNFFKRDIEEFISCHVGIEGKPQGTKVATLEEAFKGVRSKDMIYSSICAKFIASIWPLAIKDSGFNDIRVEDMIKILQQQHFSCSSEDDICSAVLQWARQKGTNNCIRTFFHKEHGNPPVRLVDLIHFDKLSDEYFKNESLEEIFTKSNLQGWQRIKFYAPGRSYGL